MVVALGLLARRSRSAKEVETSLGARGFSRAETRRVLGRLKQLGYIDDRKFAADWSERLQERGFGALRIRLELQQHGVEDGLAERVIPAAAEECVAARKILQIRFGGEPICEPALKARAARFLVGRGFTPEVVESLLDPCDV